MGFGLGEGIWRKRAWGAFNIMSMRTRTVTHHVYAPIMTMRTRTHTVSVPDCYSYVGSRYITSTLDSLLATPHSAFLTAHSSLPTPRSSLLTAHCALHTAHCSLLTAHCSLLTRFVTSTLSEWPHGSGPRSCAAGARRRRRMARASEPSCRPLHTP